MSDYEARIAQLEKQLQEMNDRQEILQCVVNNARGCDRHDVEILSSSYHADGIDEHGAANIYRGDQYADWANEVHTEGSIQNLHHITNHTCEIDGDVAHAESYVIGLFFNADGETARLLSGRYVDRLERRDGRWAIALRRCTVEVGLMADAGFMNSAYFRDMGFLKGLRNHGDVAYQRPLTRDVTADGHQWDKA